MSDCGSCGPTPRPTAIVHNLAPCPVPETPSTKPIVKPGGGTGGGGVISVGNAVWLNDAERALKIPAFVGQLGVQRDNWSVWAGLSATAGAWVKIASDPPAVWTELVWGDLEKLKQTAPFNRRPVIKPAIAFQLTSLVLDIADDGVATTAIDIMVGNLVVASASFPVGTFRVTIPATSVHPSYRTMPAGIQFNARVTSSGGAGNYQTARGLTVSGVGRWVP